MSFNAAMKKSQKATAMKKSPATVEESQNLPKKSASAASPAEICAAAAPSAMKRKGRKSAEVYDTENDTNSKDENLSPEAVEEVDCQEGKKRLSTVTPPASRAVGKKGAPPK